jgi:acetyltransferase
MSADHHPVMMRTMERHASSPSAAIRIRRIRATDEAELARFYADLSPESRRTRFLGTAALGHEQAGQLCHPDHVTGEGYVAVVGQGKAQRIVGHLCLEPDADGTPELAVAVADEWQEHGIGHRLVAHARRWASRRGIEHLSAVAFGDNVRLIRLLRSTGDPVRIRPSTDGVVEIDLELTADGAG